MGPRYEPYKFLHASGPPLLSNPPESNVRCAREDQEIWPTINLVNVSFAKPLRVTAAWLAAAFFSGGGVLASGNIDRLGPGDWHAQWIGLDGLEQTAWLQDAYPGFVGSTTRLSWIWFPAGNPEKSAPPGTYYFRRVIVVPPGKPPLKQVHFQFVGDSECRAWINGFDLGTQKDVRAVKDADITYRIKPGTNVFCLAGINRGPNPKPAGVAALLTVDFVRGDDLLFWTDGQWKVSDKAQGGWKEPAFDDLKWVPAKVLGPVGMPPWGDIRAPESRRQPARYLRKDFLVDKEVARATVYFCGLGWSEIYLNGEKLGDAVLSPGITDYSRRVYYVTYDVTKRLRKGTNELGVILGNGTYYSPRSEVYPGVISYGWPKMLLQLRIEYSDGSVSEVISDNSWMLTTQGPIRANNEYDGEEYDANYILGGWNLPGYDASLLRPAGTGEKKHKLQLGTIAATDTTPQWQPAQVVTAPAGKLVAQTGEPIRVRQTLKPIGLTEPKSGVFIFDMGRTLVGWCRLKINASHEGRVVLRYAAALKPDGTLDRTGMGGVEATDIYTSRGSSDEETWEPRFTFHRFRYVEVTGYPTKPTLDAIEGRVLNTTMKTKRGN